MINLKLLQKEIVENKKKKGFNIEDINMEFCLAYGELAEAYQAYIANEENLGEELADVIIYLLGIAELLEIDLGKELLEKVEKNKKRRYIEEDGKWIKIEG